MVHLRSYQSGETCEFLVEASGTMSALGGLASIRAATCVKPEQAPKARMRAPNLLPLGEGRWGRALQPSFDALLSRRGSGRSTYASLLTQHGRPAAIKDLRQQESEGLIVPTKPSNDGGGKEPWFGMCLNEARGERLA